VIAQIARLSRYELPLRLLKNLALAKVSVPRNQLTAISVVE
jgi:hypothetical protein